MRRLPVALACLALAASGCGGDDEEATERDTSTPIPTVPESATDTQTEPDAAPEVTPPEVTPPEQPAPDPTPAPDPPSGEGPSGGATAPIPMPDSPDNDVPPPAGSPAERFEQFCAENPRDCAQ